MDNKGTSRGLEGSLRPPAGRAKSNARLWSNSIDHAALRRQGVRGFLQDGDENVAGNGWWSAVVEVIERSAEGIDRNLACEPRADRHLVFTPAFCQTRRADMGGRVDDDANRVAVARHGRRPRGARAADHDDDATV